MFIHLCLENFELNKKKHVFDFIIGTSIINSFIFFYLSNRPLLTARGYRQLNFIKYLVRQLIGVFTTRSWFAAEKYSFLSRSSNFDLVQRISVIIWLNILINIFLYFRFSRRQIFICLVIILNFITDWLF